MQRSRLIRWGLTVLTIVSLTVLTTPAFAELKPGDKLDKSSCQEAKGLLPDVVLEKFCAGKFSAEIIEVNAGKYYITDDGYMYETATKTWPHFWYGSPFPDVDEKDTKAANKIMYNHQV